MQWKIGNVVRLMCGGPAMVVTSVEEFEGRVTVSCVWATSTREIQQDNFDSRVLFLTTMDTELR